MLCNRCELLFGECRPLAGQPCGLKVQAEANPPRHSSGEPRETVAVVVSVAPIQVVDFYSEAPNANT